jgi:hypothetical protein
MIKSKFLNTTLGLLLALIVLNNFLFVPGNILSWDVFGYYLYLPFTFIYNDLGLHNDAVVKAIIEQYHNTATFYQASQIDGGGYVMKYSMGLAVLYAPFFFIGHLLAPLLGYAQDGFSLPYQYAIFGGGILYSLAGLWFLAKVLRQLFSDTIASITLILIVLSTNYLLHISMYGQNAMSHNHLFLAYALILWLTIQWHTTYKLKTILLLGLVCGLSILSRPSEIVCLLLPLFWGVTDKTSFQEKIKLLITHKKQLLLFALLITAIGFPQLIYWKIYAGKWLFNSYGANAGEGFEFLHPYLYEVLFSFRKGWLIYTPLMLFAIIGFYFTYRINRPIFTAIFLYFVCNFYIVASWSCWWYAQSFSQRALIPSYPIMAIALGYFLTWLSNRPKQMRFVFGYILIALLGLNLFQTVQYYKGVLHGDRMTREYYAATFGKLHATDSDRELLLIDRSFDGSESFRDTSSYVLTYSEKIDFNNAKLFASIVTQGDSSACKLDSLTIYSPAIERAYEIITEKDHAWVRITADVFTTEAPETNPFCVVTHMTHKGHAYKYKTFESIEMNLELNRWNKISFDYLTPEIRRPSDPLKVYMWHMGKKPVFIDNLKVDVYTPIK